MGILFAYLILIGFLGISIGIVVPQSISSIMELTYRIPGWFNRTVDWLSGLNELFPAYDFTEINQTLENWGKNMLSYENLKNMATNIIPMLYSTSMSFISGFINFIIAIIVSVYLLWDASWFAKIFRKTALAFIAEDTVDEIAKILKECSSIFTNYVTGKMLDSLIIGILCFLLMNILRLPFALIISLIVGITNMIPYFGPYIGCIPGALIIIMISPVKMVIYLLMILCLQQFDGLVLGPKILGDSTGLRPVWIIFAVSIGGSIAGVPGMFLGVPIVAVIGYLINLWIEHRLKKKNVTI
ncbi:Permease [Lachnospiraceae bacterium TWA4]|nr:Permease [Lachnospiraceae bacterium TWA4]